MGYKMNDVVKKMDESVRADLSSSVSASGMSFYEYLSTIFEYLEQKLVALPYDYNDYLSLHDLVFVNTEDSSDSSSNTANRKEEDSEELARIEKKLKKRIQKEEQAKYKSMLETEVTKAKKQIKKELEAQHEQLL